jgi:hypothetical protein
MVGMRLILLILMLILLGASMHCELEKCMVGMRLIDSSHTDVNIVVRML